MVWWNPMFWWFDSHLGDISPGYIHTCWLNPPFSDISELLKWKPIVFFNIPIISTIYYSQNAVSPSWLVNHGCSIPLCMHMCVYVYMYVYVCKCMYMYAYVCICTYMYVCMYVRTYVYVCVCMCAYVCICMHMYAYVCICMHMYAYVCICMHMYAYVCMCMHM